MFRDILYETANESDRTQTGVEHNPYRGIYDVTMALTPGKSEHQDRLITSIETGDPCYPVQLLRNWGRRAPEKFCCVGNESLAAKPVIAVCGARNASETACMLAYACGRHIAGMDYVVASGYARGIDMHAHKGALDGGGDTIAVLPYGITKFRMHQSLCDTNEPDRMQEHMLVLSEFPRSLRFTVQGALRRNKCLVNLAGAVIVVEPGKTGGTWFTAQYARKKERPLFFLEGARGEVIEKLEKLGGRKIAVRNGEPDLEPVFALMGL